MIELKNIDLSKVTIVSQYSKAVEEENEYHEALSNFIKQADTKEHVIEEFFDENKDKDIKELIKECATKFDVKESTIERYYRNWKKESEEKKKQSIINEDIINQSEKGEKEMSKFKVLKKVVVLDLEGQYGQYHIENNTVTVADKVYKSIADVDNEFKAEEDELTKKLIELRKSKEEIKELFNEYMSE